MRFTKIVFFIALMTVNVASVYGMNPEPVQKKLVNRLINKKLPEQEILNILQETEDYEPLILQEQKNSMESLQGVNWLILQHAVDNNHQLLINFLVEKNINFSKEHATRLFDDLMITKKLQIHQKNLLNFLIKQGIDVNRALGKALCNDCPAVVVEVLIEHKVDVNVAAYLDLTPLSIAISKDGGDKLRIINALLGAGANTKVRDQHGNTAEIIAQRNHNKQTDWAKRILGNDPLSEPDVDEKPDNKNNLPPKPHVGGNPDDNNPTDSVFNVIKQHKGFALVGGVIGVGVVVWGCKKLYAKYQDCKKQQEEQEKESDNEQVEPVAD